MSNQKTLKKYVATEHSSLRYYVGGQGFSVVSENMDLPIGVINSIHAASDDSKNYWVHIQLNDEYKKLFKQDTLIMTEEDIARFLDIDYTNIQYATSYSFINYKAQHIDAGDTVVVMSKDSSTDKCKVDIGIVHGIDADDNGVITVTIVKRELTFEDKLLKYEYGTVTKRISKPTIESYVLNENKEDNGPAILIELYDNSWMEKK